MNYESLFSFAVFAEHLSFTHAARALRISQPALHVQVKKLAAAVGVALYRREGRTLVLSEEGRKLATYARETRARGDGILAELRNQTARAPVVLASGAGAFVYLLGGAIRRFPKDKWGLRLLTSSAPAAVVAVREARADLAVAALAVAPNDLHATRLTTVGQHVVLPVSHRLARKRALSAKDLEGEPLVVAPYPSPHREMLTRLLAGVTPTIAVEATGWDTMLHFAKIGVGLAVVNDFCPAPRGMRAIPLEGAPRIPYFLLARDVSALGPGQERLFSLLRDTVTG